MKQIHLKLKCRQHFSFLEISEISELNDTNELIIQLKEKKFLHSKRICNQNHKMIEEKILTSDGCPWRCY